MINLDFADVKAVMRGMGVALMGIGRAKGENAAVKAMKAAIDSKLLEENSIKGAKGALINITGSKDMPLDEIEDAISLIHEEAHDDANIIFGTVFDEEMEDEVKITVIATGFDNQAQMPIPQPMMEHAQAVSQFGGGSGGSSSSPARPGNSINRPPDKAKEEDINVPTFIRRQAD
jgi:cell division protein FtsZ